MSAPPDHHELRLQARLRARIDGTPPPPASRPRDWLDDLFDDQPAPAVTPPAPPARPPVTATDTPGEPRWDWRRLLHWPYARLCCGATLALIPVQDGQSAATGWGSALRDCRTQAGVLPAWLLASLGISLAAVLVHRRRSWWTYSLLTTAFIGTVAMASPFDLVTFMTGVTK